MLRESEWWGGAGRAEKGGVPVVGARHVAKERANSCMCLESLSVMRVSPGGGSGAVIFI